MATSDSIPVPSGLQGAAYLAAVNKALSDVRTGYRDTGPQDEVEIGETLVSPLAGGQYQREFDGDAWLRLWRLGIGPMNLTPGDPITASGTITPTVPTDAILRDDPASAKPEHATYYPVLAEGGDIVAGVAGDFGPGHMLLVHRVDADPSNKVLVNGRYLSPGDWLLALQVYTGGSDLTGGQLVYLREPVASVYNVGTGAELEVTLAHTTVHLDGSDDARMLTHAAGVHGGRVWHFKNTSGVARTVFVQPGDAMNGVTSGSVVLAAGESCTVYSDGNGWFSR